MHALIAGEKVDSEKKIAVRNPATGEIIDYVPSLSLEEIRRAIDVAYEEFIAGRYTPAKRSSLLLTVASKIRERSEDLAKTMTLESGRPIKSSRAEIERAAKIFELAATEVRRALEGRFVPLDLYDLPAGNENRIAIVKREPLGVVGAITPFNFPAASFAHKVAPALAVGNTVVFKPSSSTPLTQIKMAEIVNELMPKAVNVVTGSAEVIGNEFIENSKISLITFTGSADVGLDLASKAIKNGKRIIMELGGSDAMIVLEDADLNKAVKSALIGRFDFGGQFCNATKRIIVRKEIEEEFSKRLVEEVRKMKAGNPLSEDVDVPPLISEQAVLRMKEFLNDAVSKGGQVLFQGNVPSIGYYFPPTVLRVYHKSNVRVLKEEVFGPILPIAVVEKDEEAVEIANSTEYGLDASIFTSNFGRAWSIASKLKTGTVIINDTTRLRWDNLPFGGVKKSGIGREGVLETMIEMTEPKMVVINTR